MEDYEIIDPRVTPPYFITVPPTPDPEPELDAINSGDPPEPELSAINSSDPPEPELDAINSGDPPELDPPEPSETDSSITEYVQEIERLQHDSEKLEKELVEKAIQKEKDRRLAILGWSSILGMMLMPLMGY